jgi:hypothetical protein
MDIYTFGAYVLIAGIVLALLSGLFTKKDKE